MPPLTIMIKPASGLCNLRCTYCFYADVTARRTTSFFGVMSLETLENLMRRAFAYADGHIGLAFQGGEPTLAGKDFFRRVLALEKKYNRRGLQVSNAIQTNGYTLDSEWMEIFREGRFLVGVSVDGTRELHDACRLDSSGGPTYDKVVEGLALLASSGIDYNILCVVNQSIASHPQEVFRNLQSHRFLQFIPCLDDFDGTRNQYSLDSHTYGQFLIDTFGLYEKAWQANRPVSVRNFDNWIGIMLGQPPENCAMAGRCGSYYLVEADGGVYPCDFYVLDPWRMGNINDVSFFRLEKSPVAQAFREASWELPDPCKQCPWFSLCRGGCKRDREPILSGQPSLNRLCDGHRMFFEACEPRMRALANGLLKKQGCDWTRP